MSTRTQPDALTIAYIAIGAEAALMSARKARPFAMFADGHLETMDSIIEHALMLDTLADPIDAADGFSGVFLYEVAEPFGYEYAAALFDGEEPDAGAIATRLIAGASV